MRRLPAAPPRPALSPAAPSLGTRQQYHGRLALARTAAPPVVCCSCFLPNRTPNHHGPEPLRSARSADRDARGPAMGARAGPVAASAGAGGEASSPYRSPLAVLAELWRRTVQPLGDYGFGKRGVWEGGVGLFMVSGAALLALALAWLRGFRSAPGSAVSTVDGNRRSWITREKLDLQELRRTSSRS